MKRIGVLCISALLSGCGQGAPSNQSTQSKETGSAGTLQANSGPKPDFTAADWNRCTREVPHIAISAERQIIQIDESNSISANYTDDTIDRIRADGNTAFSVVPSADGSCTRLLGRADTVVNGNQIKFERECHIIHFSDDGNGKTADFTEHCKRFEGILPASG